MLDLRFSLTLHAYGSSREFVTSRQQPALPQCFGSGWMGQYRGADMKRGADLLVAVGLACTSSYSMAINWSDLPVFSGQKFAFEIQDSNPPQAVFTVVNGTQLQEYTYVPSTDNLRLVSSFQVAVVTQGQAWSATVAGQSVSITISNGALSYNGHDTQQMTQGASEHLELGDGEGGSPLCWQECFGQGASCCACCFCVHRKGGIYCWVDYPCCWFSCGSRC